MQKRTINPNTPQLWDKILFERDNELLMSPYYKDKIDRVYKFLKNRKGEFLDIGFGMGNLERKMIMGGVDLNIYGIDFSRKAISKARKEIKGKFYAARPHKLPFKKSYFDFVAMLDVLEHIPQIESKKVLDEINKVMKKKSFLVISVPVNEDLKKMNEDGTNLNAHLRQYTPEMLEKELSLSGFEVMKKDFIYAFRKYYLLKNIAIKIWPSLRKPNVLLIYSRKIK